jgi:hypothetical protein
MTDTVVVPAGTGTDWGSITLTKAITLQGAGSTGGSITEFATKIQGRTNFSST